MQDQQPRDDYKELLELILVFGGDTPPKGMKFRYPGALSRARWMMYLIYGLKVWMFRKQFSLTEEEEKGLRQLCLFAFNVYVERWYTCPLATSAPNQDLTLFHELRVLSQVRNRYSRLKKQQTTVSYISLSILITEWSTSRRGHCRTCETPGSALVSQ